MIFFFSYNTILEQNKNEMFLFTLNIYYFSRLITSNLFNFICKVLIIKYIPLSTLMVDKLDNDLGPLMFAGAAQKLNFVGALLSPEVLNLLAIK